MRNLGTKTLETKRLVLRRFEIADAELMYRNWASDSEVTKFLTWPPHGSVDGTKAFLEEWTSAYGRDNFYDWVIVLKEINEPIGSIGIVQQRDDIRMVHVGYCLGKKWWRQGITSEALLSLIQFFFEEVGVNRFESRHDTRNPNSGKVMVKCGLVYEGTMRQADVNNQGICDISQYGLLAEGYFAKIPE